MYQTQKYLQKQALKCIPDSPLLSISSAHLSMVPCLAVPISTSPVLTSISNHTFEVLLSMVSPLFMLMHWPKILLMVVSSLLKRGVTWLRSKQSEQGKRGKDHAGSESVPRVRAGGQHAAAAAQDNKNCQIIILADNNQVYNACG